MAILGLYWLLGDGGLARQNRDYLTTLTVALGVALLIERGPVQPFAIENDRLSMTITVPRVEARTVGGLIALFERAVGFYASLVNINAYHQPGVEAGKKAAAAVLGLQSKILGALSTTPQTAAGWRIEPPVSVPMASGA